MANRVVSTKLNEEEHKRIMQICSEKGITVSKLLKKTLMEQIREEKQQKQSSNNFRNNSQKRYQEQSNSEKFAQNKEQSFRNNDDRFMYY